MPARTTPDDLRRILQQTRTVAVLGAHPQRHRAAFYVPEHLYSVGYRIYPVNPMKLGETLWGQPVRAALTELPEPIDMVDVFRRSTALAGHLDEILAMAPLPRVVWLQLGIRDDDFTQQLMDAGIEVVEDRCTLAEHRRLF